MVDIIVARSSHQDVTAGSPEASAASQPQGSSRGGPLPAKPLGAAVRRRRRLPVLDRPRSAPLSGELISDICNAASANSGQETAGKDDQGVLDVCDFSSKQAAMKTVIKVSSIKSPAPPTPLTTPPEAAAPTVSIPVIDHKVDFCA